MKQRLQRHEETQLIVKFRESIGKKKDILFH